jgi:hypothetical protein
MEGMLIYSFTCWQYWFSFHGTTCTFSCK